MSYLLDANVFIQAKNLHYGFDFCPAFWEWLLQNNAEGRVFSIDKVADEIAAGTDELSDWLSHTGDGLFMDTDSRLLRSSVRSALGQPHKAIPLPRSARFCRSPITTLKVG